MSADSSPNASSKAQPGLQSQAYQGALSARSLLLAILFMVVGTLWVRKASLLAFTILVGEGTPPVPALTALVLLTALGMGWVALTRSGRWRREALLVYVILSLSFVTTDANGIRQLLATISSPLYFAEPGNDYRLFAQQMPNWIAPHDEEAIRDFYEGTEHGRVPWRAWAPSLVAWGALFLVLSLSLVCLVSLFRKPWAEHERLTFPLAELILRLGPDPLEDRTQTPLLRSGLFWVGVGIAAVYNISNIAHAFVPTVSAIGQNYDLGQLLTERPWSALRPLNLTFRPEMVGLGYLVPLDVLFSVWFFYLLLRVENFMAVLFGYELRGFPYDGAQGMGSHLGLAVFVLYAARRHLAEVLRAALGGPAPTGDEQEAIPSRLAFWGACLGAAAVTGFMVAAGMSLGTALAYVLLIYLCVLVYARIRAQTGLPITYGIPREEIGTTLLDLQPTRGYPSEAVLRAETMFTVFRVLVRMTFGQLAAYALEGIRIGHRSRIRHSHLLIGVFLGLLGGLLLANWIHLDAAYEYGWNVLDGGTTSAGYRTGQARGAYNVLQSRISGPTPVQWSRTAARGAGLGLTVLMVWLRARYLRFPLNPMGLALAGTFGGPIWFPLFLAWLAKTLILRLGGAHTYRSLTPMFLGIAMGHFLIAGGIWGLVGAFSEEVARRYLLWFA